MPRVAYGGIQKLASNQARKEEGIDGQSDNLEQRETQWERGPAIPASAAVGAQKQKSRA